MSFAEEYLRETPSLAYNSAYLLVFLFNHLPFRSFLSSENFETSDLTESFYIQLLNLSTNLEDATMQLDSKDPSIKDLQTIKLPKGQVLMVY